MISRIKINRRFLTLVTLAIIVCLMCAGVVGMTAQAEGQAKGQAFDIEAELMPSGGAAYDIRLTVENTGEDWEGTVRLMVLGATGAVTDCAYDTALSLPQGGTKQFVVRVPKESIYSTNDEIWVTLLDKKSNVDAGIVFKDFLGDDAKTLTMGILSDDYYALTYLDMGGEKIDFYSDEYPIKLMELNKDNLTDLLYSLTFLVIDTYNTGILTDDEILDIKKWVNDGGVLIIGTGSYAEDTLSGFDYLGVECKKVYSPENNTQTYYSDYLDWSQLNMAELKYKDSQYYCEEYSNLVVAKPQGDGAVGILPYALSELGSLDAVFYNYHLTQSEFVECILDGVSANAIERFRYSNQYGNSDNIRVLRRILNMFGNNSTILNFGVLKFIVIVYVIIAGPVLYLILRFVKKRELYWVAVPVTALVGILLVFFAGRGFEVASTRVYSVTAYNLSDRRDCTTYLYCYDAGHREWRLRLAEGYEYIGPQISYGYGNDDEYYYHIMKEGDRLFFGMKPSSGFEDSYFCAGRAVNEQEADGSIDSVSKLDIIRAVTNNTDHDFVYFAVVKDDSVQVYKGLPAGEMSSLTGDEMVFSASLSGYYSYFNEYMSEAMKHVKRENRDAVFALGVGVNLAYHRMNAYETAIIGVVEDWDKAVDDNCSEVSYGCFYIIN